MITNFEEITEELTQDELSIIPYLVKGFETKTKDNPIKAHDLIRMFNAFCETNKWKFRLTEPRLRKCVHFIRVQGIMPLIATSSGYYVSYDQKEIEKQITSLRQRAQSILDCADGLQKFLN
jgi:hypothetical protein